MATYRQVHICFWQDPYIEELEPLEKYFYLYLMTNSKTKQCGCYEISMKLIKYETGLSQEEIDFYINKFQEEKKVFYNPESSEFLIVNWLKHNSFTSPKVKKCIEGEMKNIKTEIFHGFVESVLFGNEISDSVSIVYDSLSEIKNRVSEAADRGPQKEKEKEKEEKKKKKKEGKNIPPSLDEVRQYCKKRNNGINADNFVNFYESKGWHVGKNKMKNWQAAIRTWENKDKERNGNPPTVPPETTLMFDEWKGE